MSTKNKGKYRLCEDFFSDNQRNVLPVNLFVLRVQTKNDASLDSRFYINSKFHKNEKRIGAYFYKSISND